MNKEEPKEKEQQVFHVYSKDINNKKFTLKPGVETIMILEEEEYEDSE